MPSEMTTPEVDPRILKMLEYGRSLLKDDEVLEWGGTISIYRRKAVNPYTPQEKQAARAK